MAIRKYKKRLTEKRFAMNCKINDDKVYDIMKKKGALHNKEASKIMREAILFTYSKQQEYRDIRRELTISRILEIENRKKALHEEEVLHVKELIKLGYSDEEIEKFLGGKVKIEKGFFDDVVSVFEKDKKEEEAWEHANNKSKPWGLDPKVIYHLFVLRDKVAISPQDVLNKKTEELLNKVGIKNFLKICDLFENKELKKRYSKISNIVGNINFELEKTNDDPDAVFANMGVPA